MADDGGQVRSGRGGSTSVEESLLLAVRDRFEETETAERGLGSASPVVHEHRDEEDVFRPGPDGRSLAVVSDRQLYFAVGTPEEAEVVTVPYRDVRSIEAGDSLFDSSLTVRVWNRGYYHFSPDGGEDVTDAADTLERFVDGWQRVLAVLDAAREHITELGRHVENAADDAAAESRSAVERELSRATTRIQDAPEPVRAALHERVDRVTTELQRRRVRAHVARATDLVDAGEAATEAESWDDALEALTAARDHYETALEAARERGFDVVEPLRTELADLVDSERRLVSRPFALGEEARAEAQGVDDRAAAAAAWDEALSYYRAALTAALRVSPDTEANTDALRWQVEWTVRNLVDARRHRARELEEMADRRNDEGLVESSRHDYRDAARELAAAAELAGELSVGDATAIREQHERVREKLGAD